MGAGEWSISSGYGYKENVLFSEIVPIDSPFAYVGLEGIAQREFIESGGEWTTMALLDNRHYFNGGDLPDETFGLLLSEYGKYVTVDGKLTGGVQYIYFNQAFDTTFDVLDVRQIVITAQEPRLYLEWEGFFWQFEYGFEAVASRMYFDDPQNDYETLDWEIDIDYLLGEKTHLLVAVNGFARDYTDRQPRDREGDRIVDAMLGTDQLGLEISLEQPARWAGFDIEAEVGLDFEMRHDRHFGYYDRDRLKYFIDIKAEGERWSLRADIGCSDRDYVHQLADSGSLRK